MMGVYVEGFTAVTNELGEWILVRDDMPEFFAEQKEGE